MKFTDIEPGKRILMHIRSGDYEMDLGAYIEKHLKNNIAIINLDYAGKERLLFENVQISMEYFPENELPYLWMTVQVITHKNQYIMQAQGNGVRHNRRTSFRVGVSKQAYCIVAKGGSERVLVRDVSLSGFSITDRKKSLDLDIGDRLSVSFEDLGYKILLEGRVVRIDESKDGSYLTYGMVIINVCKDLSAYVNTKQIENRRRKNSTMEK